MTTMYSSYSRSILFTTKSRVDKCNKVYTLSNEREDNPLITLLPPRFYLPVNLISQLLNSFRDHKVDFVLELLDQLLLKVISL